MQTLNRQHQGSIASVAVDPRPSRLLVVSKQDHHPAAAKQVANAGGAQASWPAERPGAEAGPAGAGPWAAPAGRKGLEPRAPGWQGRRTAGRRPSRLKP